MQNIKDTLTTICGVVLAIAGAILAVATAGVALPVIVITIATTAAAVSGAVIGFLTGKNPDGSTKGVAQVIQQNNQAK